MHVGFTTVCLLSFIYLDQGGLGVLELGTFVSRFLGLPSSIGYNLLYKLVPGSTSMDNKTTRVATQLLLDFLSELGPNFSPEAALFKVRRTCAHPALTISS